MVKVSEQDIIDCIRFFDSKEIYAYEHYGKIYVDLTQDDLSLEISADEIIARANQYRDEIMNEEDENGESN